MSRRYADPVQVQRGDADPTQFLWRDKLYVVRTVLARWSESGRWWRVSPTLTVAAPVDIGAERDYWRVEAGAGRTASLGVYDLCFDWSRGAWFLACALD
ncbi:MAG: DUF6504 family protein [Mycobacteriales bacterium]